MTTLKQAQADPKAMFQLIAEYESLEVDGEHFDAVMEMVMLKFATV